jgi:hypothetical protein
VVFLLTFKVVLEGNYGVENRWTEILEAPTKDHATDVAKARLVRYKKYVPCRWAEFTVEERHG